MKPQNQQKCEECGDSIPKGKEKYVNAKKVCEYCFFKLKKYTKNDAKGRDFLRRYLSWWGLKK